MPPLPFEAQSVDQMRARWNESKKYFYVYETIANGGIRPGEVRANVFDFEGGLRVIASVEKKDDKRYLHLSASFGPNTTEYRNFERLIDKWGTALAARKWPDTVIERFKIVAGEDINGIKFLGYSSGNVPHWVKELKEDETASK